jgi:hypothetical protein
MDNQFIVLTSNSYKQIINKKKEDVDLVADYQHLA